MNRPPFKMTPTALAAWMHCMTIGKPGQLARMLAYTDAREGV